MRNATRRATVGRAGVSHWTEKEIFQLEESIERNKRELESRVHPGHLDPRWKDVQQEMGRSARACYLKALERRIAPPGWRTPASLPGFSISADTDKSNAPWTEEERRILWDDVNRFLHHHNSSTIPIEDRVDPDMIWGMASTRFMPERSVAASDTGSFHDAEDCYEEYQRIKEEHRNEFNKGFQGASIRSSNRLDERRAGDHSSLVPDSGTRQILPTRQSYTTEPSSSSRGESRSRDGERRLSLGRHTPVARKKANAIASVNIEDFQSDSDSDREPVP